MQCPPPQRGHRSNGAAGAVLHAGAVSHAGAVAHADAVANGRNGAPPQSIELVVETTNRYYATALIYETVTRMMTVQSLKHLVRTVVMKREMVFAYWDPLPFFAHYSLQMIVDRINTALDEAAILLSSAQKNRYTTF